MRDKTLTKLVRGTSITIGKEYDYVVYTLQKDGILIKKTNNPPQKGFVFHRESSTAVVVIPTRIRIAYGIEDYVKLRDIDEETMFLEAELQGEAPIPYMGLGFKFTDDLKLDEKPTCTAYVSGINKLYVGSTMPEEWTWRKIKVFAGDALRIEVSDASSRTVRKNYATFDELQEEYGKRLQHYGGKSMCFVKKINDESAFRTVPIPKFFRIHANVSAGDIFDCYEINKKGKRTFVFSQQPKTCELTEEKIIPAEEKPEEIVLCEECAEEKDELAEVMQQILELKNLVGQVAAMYKETKEENIKLKEKLSKIGGILNV